MVCLSAFTGSPTEMSPREKGEPRPILAPLFFAESQAEAGTEWGGGMGL